MAKKFKWLIVFIGVFIVASSFVTAEKWYLFEDKDCSILFPKKVETTSQQVASELGPLTLFITMYDASQAKNDDNLVYGLFTSVYPDSVIHSNNKIMLPGFYRGAIDGAVKNVKGTLLSESTITINDYEGREFRVNYSEGLAVIKMRCFLVKNVMYMLQTICLTEKENNVSSQKFFDSFKLKM
ncbi:MAG: hypothetical protein IPK62_07935 [Bacteroidetes bacterium]|nr:hypothetical protein [Bacteroidota bacterium]MBK8144920.1 hypothetical protein [Bacteroidota bacterium]MBP6315677.1 hypothetical protein [Chitinophagaceae bacterium]